MANFLRTILAYAYVSKLDGPQEVADRILGAAIERGDAMKAAMLEEEGGTLDVEGFAEAIGASLPDFLDLILACKAIQVWIESMKKGVFPAFQARDGRLLAGLPEVLDALDTKSRRGKLNFMLTPDRRLGGVHPPDALRARDVAGGYMSAGT